MAAKRNRTDRTPDRAQDRTPASPQVSEAGFLEYIEREIAAAEREIAQLHQKIEVLASLRDNFTARPPDSPAPADRGFTSKQTLATEAIADFLRRQQGPVPTTRLLDYLAQRGIKFGGQQPRNALSVLLSRSKLFKAHGRQGWTLVEP
jgi:hypothetical protein